jgi:hypothetical protein
MLLAASSAAQATTTYDNTNLWNGSSYLQPWSGGGWNTATYGQLVSSTPFSSILNSFDFFINTSGSAIKFYAQVYQWDSAGNQATGSALYSSDLLQVQSSSFQDVHVGTGAINLTSGNQYVLMFTTYGITQAAASAVWGWVANDNLYGKNVWHNNDSTGQPNVGYTWDGPFEFAKNSSLAFKATFNGPVDETLVGATVVRSTPGPIAGAGLPAALLGLVGFAAWRRRLAS